MVYPQFRLGCDFSEEVKIFWDSIIKRVTMLADSYAE